MSIGEITILFVVTLHFVLKIVSVILDQNQNSQISETLLVIKELVQVGKDQNKETKDLRQKITDSNNEMDSERIPVLKKVAEVQEAVEQVPKKVAAEIKKDSDHDKGEKL